MTSKAFIVYVAKTGEIQGKYTSPDAIDHNALHRDPGQRLLPVPPSHPALGDPEAWIVKNGKLEQR